MTRDTHSYLPPKAAYQEQWITWQDLRILVRYNRDYHIIEDLNCHMTHLEVIGEPYKEDDIKPYSTSKHITKPHPLSGYTGYKSLHHPYHEGIDTMKQVIAHVLAWMDKEANSRQWKDHLKAIEKATIKANQPSLFSQPKPQKDMTTQKDIEGNETPNQVLNLTHIDTGSQGYLKVSHELLYRIIKGKLESITGYSGINSTHAFLEEDQDASFFLHMAREKGYTWTITTEHNERFRTHHNYDPKRVKTPMGSGNAKLEVASRQATMFEPQQDLFAQQPKPKKETTGGFFRETDLLTGETWGA